MNKIFIYLILLIFLISFVSSVSFGVSPAKLVFNEKQNEEICNNFSVFMNEGRTFSGEIKWSNKKSREISDYTLSSKEAGLKILFPAKIEEGQYRICISAENEGEKYGILSYKLENSSYAVGIWIEVNVTKNKFNPILLLTGKTTEGNSQENIFVFTPLLLLIILILLLIKLKKINREC
jgi:hypothetical protein